MPEPMIDCIRPKWSLLVIVLTAIGFGAMSDAGGEVPPVLSIRLEEAQMTEDIAFFKIRWGFAPDP
jgi:hypothetical protein